MVFYIFTNKIPTNVTCVCPLSQHFATVPAFKYLGVCLYRLCTSRDQNLTRSSLQNSSTSVSDVAFLLNSMFAVSATWLVADRPSSGVF